MAVVETIETRKAKLEFFQTQLADQFVAQEKKIDDGMASLQMLVNTWTDSMNLKLEESLENHKEKILQDADIAKKEFDQVQKDHQAFYDKSEKTFTDLNKNYAEFYGGASTAFIALQASVAGLETSGPSGHTPEKRVGPGHGYIPAKSMMPKSFTDKIEDWRSWKEEIEEFLDMSKSGMKKLLVRLHEMDADADASWPGPGEGHDDKVRLDGVNVWRALKKLTDGEARKVVTSVKGEDGFMAWQHLRMRFEPSQVAKKGNLLAEFTGMVGKPAKTPFELIVILTEMDKKIKLIEDVLNKDLDEIYKKSVIVGVLDPMTRQHTATDQDEEFHDLKNTILKFANNMAINKSTTKKDDAMAIDSVEEKGDDEIDIETLNALQRQNLQCHSCQGWGHFARDCPSKSDGQGPPRKGKGEGKDTSKGGGNFNGNNGACAICKEMGHWKARAKGFSRMEKAVAKEEKARASLRLPGLWQSGSTRHGKTTMQYQSSVH